MVVVHGPVVIRRRLGAALKKLRVEQGMQLGVVARQLEISPSKLSRLETGQVSPRIRDVRDLLEIYQATPDLRDRAMKWAMEAREPGWWQPFSAAIENDLDLYISLEAESRRIAMFSLPVSGLLQTAAYASALLEGAAPQCSDAEIDRLVEIRIGRQRVLDAGRVEAPPVDLHVVLDEAALHRCSSAETMAGQLRELVTRSEWPHVTLQILPFAAGYPMASSTFAIFDPRDESDVAVVNVESTGQDAYFDSPGDVARYRSIWNDLSGRALSPASSRALISDILRQG